MWSLCRCHAGFRWQVNGRIADKRPWWSICSGMNWSNIGRCSAFPVVWSISTIRNIWWAVWRRRWWRWSSSCTSRGVVNRTHTNTAQNVGHGRRAILIRLVIQPRCGCDQSIGFQASRRIDPTIAISKQRAYMRWAGSYRSRCDRRSITSRCLPEWRSRRCG